MPTIGVLALQGDFQEHRVALRRIGAEATEVRTSEGLRGLDGLIIPGGESTTFCRLTADFGMEQPLSAFVHSGVPVWGTCAGLILLAQEAHGLNFPTLGAIDIEVDRNAYGRQVDSFEADISMGAIGEEPFRAVFIRAPVILSIGADVNVLATHQHEPGTRPAPIAVRQDQILATSFHPELTGDDRIHRYFAGMVEQAGRTASAK
jgi:5'-phosphate synthase pdxT subunit